MLKLSKEEAQTMTIGVVLAVLTILGPLLAILLGAAPQ